MFCIKCGKENPEGARFCNFCGAEMPQIAPRHAKPDDDDIYSYSDRKSPSDFDTLKTPDPVAEETKVYDFGMFEDAETELLSSQDADDETTQIGDSYEMYQDGEDDRTMMDKLDDRFRRDDYGRQPKKNLTWLWVTLSVVAVILIAVIAILVVNGAQSKNKKTNVKPTVSATAAATVKATEAPATAAPTTAAPTQAPATQAPETQAPAPTEAPPITVAPAPTDAPVETYAPVSSAEEEESPVADDVDQEQPGL